MVLPIVLAAVGGAGALAAFGGSAGDQAVDIAGEVVEESFAVMGKGLVKGVAGMTKAIREEVKGHEVTVSATITVLLISIFFFRTYISPRVGVQ